MAGRFGDGRVSAENAAGARKTPVYRGRIQDLPVQEAGVFCPFTCGARCSILRDEPGGSGCKRQRADVTTGGTEVVKL